MPEIETIKTIAEMRTFSRRMRRGGLTVGLVPTMGALHEGHLSLMRRAREESGVVIASIFVNPTQFGPGEDLENYPRDLEADTQAAEAVGVDTLFVPSVEEMYPRPEETFIQQETLTKVLCGAARPTHFRGVLTVVAKLFHIVEPDLACFGQKDYQQSVVIRRMVEDLNFPVKIVACPTVREPDGLAMSSRNRYLSPDEREDALCLSRSLRLVEDLVQKGETSAEGILRSARRFLEQTPSARIDYVELTDPDTLQPVKTVESKVLFALAVKIGKTRLIDNILVQPPSR